MKLPVINKPVFSITIPSTKKELVFRQYLVKEEKILLMAQQSKNDTEMIRSIKQVISLCAQTPFDVDSLTTFDLEYVFLKLRSRSVNNVVKLTYRDNEDDELYNFEINLDDIEVQIPENVDGKIKITDKVGMIMKYPSASITDKMVEFEDEIQLLTFFIVNCIDKIYDDENVYASSEYTQEELSEFLDTLDVSTFDKIKDFFETIPKLQHTITYTNKKSNERKIELNSLKDFFM